jgi:hypothetical protein
MTQELLMGLLSLAVALGLLFVGLPNRRGGSLSFLLHMAPLVHLLQTSLAQEENADQLLNQLAQPLMSVAKVPESVE